MKILRDYQQLNSYIQKCKSNNKTIGFAPTMGALHKGHLSLYQKAKEENDVVISSIFVNPTQFNNPKDLEKYPRTEERDIEMLKQIGVDAVYIPRVEDIYPTCTESKQYDFDKLDKVMEGKFRPGHFDGVGTVVEILLRQVEPDNAYFGEKDYQQLAIIKNLTKKLQLPVKIHSVPTLREANGLAMSSRNERLTSDQREKAKLIHETLLKVKDWFRIVSISEIKKRVEEIFEKDSDFKLEYFIIADENTLQETDFFYKDKKYRAFIVVFVGEVRLIDNMPLD